MAQDTPSSEGKAAAGRRRLTCKPTPEFCTDGCTNPAWYRWLLRADKPDWYRRLVHVHLLDAELAAASHLHGFGCMTAVCMESAVMQCWHAGNRQHTPWRCGLDTSTAKRPTSHANPAAALVREGVRGRSQALDRSLRTPPKCPTRAKEQGCQLAGASSVCGHPGIIRYSSRNNTVETSYYE